MCQTSNIQVQNTLEYPDKKLLDSFHDHFFLNTNFLNLYICDYEKAFD